MPTATATHPLSRSAVARQQGCEVRAQRGSSVCNGWEFQPVEVS